MMGWPRDILRLGFMWNLRERVRGKRQAECVKTAGRKERRRTQKIRSESKSESKNKETRRLEEKNKAALLFRFRSVSVGKARRDPNIFWLHMHHINGPRHYLCPLR